MTLCHPTTTITLAPCPRLPPASPWPPDWDARLTSTFPDTLTKAANKTALTALGCYDCTKPHVPTQLALPMMCLDDSTGACGIVRGGRGQEEGFVGGEVLREAVGPSALAAVRNCCPSSPGTRAAASP